MSSELLARVLLASGALSCGLMAGVYFAFSAFVMTALRAVPATEGAAVMRSINRVILRSAFMPLFFGSSAAALLLLGHGVLRWPEPAGAPTLLGAVVYLAGMLGVTVRCSVPLNRRLDASAADADAAWADYAAGWTAWNHVRTVSSLAACVLFALALWARA